MIHKRVAVLMAAFNGAEYIHEQVFSLLDQVEVSVDIYIRVDGECKKFINQVKELDYTYPNIFYVEGDIESSPSSNFYKLIMGAKSKNYDYFALCDQDDIWHPNKLNRALSFFKGNDPQGYSAGYTIYNSNGSCISYDLGAKSKNDYLFQAGGPGCTFVINSSGINFFQDYMSSNKILFNVLAHDWLIYFIFRINSKNWYIDSSSNIMYRQHSSNVAGVNKGIVAKYNRIKILFSGWYIHDLKILINFAKKNKNIDLNFKNPFNLRRSKLESLLIYIYLNFYFKFIIKNKT